MNSKFIAAIVVVVAVLSVLIYSASTATAKAVVTVEELLEEGNGRARVRLGARVADQDIEYRSEPERQVSFLVKDIQGKGSTVPVVYYGAMPDTLKTGRDVILEGDYDGQRFVAKSLMTQCPSKYEPPLPDGSVKGDSYD
jgi:cytochrome c-type biogenesis protein CcmE